MSVKSPLAQVASAISSYRPLQRCATGVFFCSARTSSYAFGVQPFRRFKSDTVEPSAGDQLSELCATFSTLSPSQLATLPLSDRIAVVKLGQLSEDQRGGIPVTVLTSIARSLAFERLGNISTLELAELCVALRSAKVGEADSAAASALVSLEAELSKRDLTGLPDDLAVNALQVVIDAIRSPALKSLAAELVRRAVAEAKVGELALSVGAIAAKDAEAASGTSQRVTHQGRRSKQNESNGGWKAAALKGTRSAVLVGAVFSIGIGATLWATTSGPAPPGRVVASLENATPDSVVSLLRYVHASLNGKDLEAQQAQTIVAAACMAMVRSGLSKYSSGQLAAISTLVPRSDHDDPTKISSALIPRKFLETLVDEVHSRNPESFDVSDRIELAYAFVSPWAAQDRRQRNYLAASKLLASLAPSAIEDLFSSPSLLQHYAHAALCCGIRSARSAEALAKAVVKCNAETNLRPREGAGAAIGPNALSIRALWDILQLFDGIDLHGPAVTTCTREIAASLISRKEFRDVSTKTLLQMLQLRAARAGHSATPSSSSSTSANRNKSDHVWAHLDNSYVDLVMDQLVHRFARHGIASNNSKSGTLSSTSMATLSADTAETTSLITAIWLALKQPPTSRTKQLVSAAAAAVSSRQLKLADNPRKLAMLLESLSLCATGEPSCGDDVARVHLARSAQAALLAMNSSSTGGFAMQSYASDDCMRLLHAALDADDASSRATDSQRIPLASAPGHQSLSSSELKTLRKQLSELCSTIAAELLRRFDATQTKAASAASSGAKSASGSGQPSLTLSLDQRRTLLADLQRASTLASVDLNDATGKQKVDSSYPFVRLRSLLHLSSSNSSGQMQPAVA